MNEEELMAAREHKEAFYVSTIMSAKLKIDLAYCQNVRFGDDLRMLFATLARLAANLFNVFGLAPASSEIHLSKVRDGSTRQTLP